MYLSKLIIENFRCFGEGDNRFEMTLKPGLTALVGENDSGKTAVIDALRFALGTNDQEWNGLEDSDFNASASSRVIRIVCKFDNLSSSEQRAFIEYLTFDKDNDNEPVLYVHWTARDTGEVRRGRPYRRTEVLSGEKGDGPQLDVNARDLLRATYLRPLRNAEQALSAGRGSRLAQILRSSKILNDDSDYSIDEPSISEPLHVQGHNLSILGIAMLIDKLLLEQKAIKEAREEINNRLKELALRTDSIASEIKISGSDASDDIRIRQLLEKLDLTLDGAGKPGLGSNNLLFMAAELLLLAEEDEGNKLLLIEEPEAHLHAQRQLQAMKFLQEQATNTQDDDKNGVQIIITTHSPNLASAIDLENIVIIHNRRAYPMSVEQTKLEKSDYRFLQRFLDVTKANLFFARAVVIVEGDAENILLPTLAKLIGRGFTKHGVSIVNVGGIGLRRYARIFQRSDTDVAGMLDIPVACITDMDVMPNCAPALLGRIKGGDSWPEISERRWRAKGDYVDAAELERRRGEIAAKASGQKVKTFVSNEWTLEYNLALGPKNGEGKFTAGLAEDVFVAASFAAEDGALNSRRKTPEDVERSAKEEYAKLKEGAIAKEECASEEVIATKIYAKFFAGRVSKSIAAQYLAEKLQDHVLNGRLTPKQLRSRLPKYLVDAIEYVTGGSSIEEPRPEHEDSADE